MKRRNLSDEINAGLNHLEKARLGKAALHSVELEMRSTVAINAKEVSAMRDRFLDAVKRIASVLVLKENSPNPKLKKING